MMNKVSWLEANFNDPKVANLVTRLVKAEKHIEAGGCGCGCGEAHAESPSRGAVRTA
jgi:hypothetical protein